MYKYYKHMYVQIYNDCWRLITIIKAHMWPEFRKGHFVQNANFLVIFNLSPLKDTKSLRLYS